MNSKKAMYDDLFFAPVVTFFAGNKIYNGEASGFIITVFIFGLIWTAARLYHVTHHKEVFGEDEVKP